MTQRHEMTILGAPPAVFASAALLSPGVTGFACTEKWYTSKRLAGFPHGSADRSIATRLPRFASQLHATNRCAPRRTLLTSAPPAREWDQIGSDVILAEDLERLVVRRASLHKKLVPKSEVPERF